MLYVFVFVNRGVFKFSEGYDGRHMTFEFGFIVFHYYTDLKKKGQNYTIVVWMWQHPITTSFL